MEMETPNGDLPKPPTLIDSMRPFNGDINEFTENTTIHGLKYLGERRRPWAEKIFWILIFVFCFIVLGYFIYIIVEKWQRCPVILIEDDEFTPIHKLPFPAVTICPQIKMRFDVFNYEKHILNETMITETDRLYIAVGDLICNRIVSASSKNILREHLTSFLNTSAVESLYTVSPEIDDVILMSSFDTKFFSSADLLKHADGLKEKERLFETVLTNEGVCFTFNMPKDVMREELIQKDYPLNDLSRSIENWDFEDGYNLEGSEGELFPKNNFGAGVQFSLTVILQHDPKDMYRICQPSEAAYKVAIHSPGIYPNTFEDYILVDYSTASRVAIDPRVIKTSKELQSYSPEKRQCYFNNERKLKYFTIYNRVNCKLECFANLTLEQEGCVHFSLPMESGTKICGSKENHYQDWYDYSENMDAYLNFMESFEQVENFNAGERKKALPCDCLPECNSIEYNYNVETEEVKLHDEETGDVKKSAKTEIKIYFKSTRVYGKTRNQLYMISDLVSNFGGLIGLFMGASILSGFEFVYFCTVRHFCSNRCK